MRSLDKLKIAGLRVRRSGLLALDSCVTHEGYFPAGISLGHELDDPLNLLDAKMAAVALPACRSPATGKAKKKECLHIGGQWVDGGPRTFIRSSSY